MNTKMKDILFNRWAVFLVMLPHIGLFIFSNAGGVELVLRAWQLAVFLPLLLMVFAKINTLNVFVLFLMAITILSAYFNHTFSSGIFYTVIVFIGFCFYVSYAVKNFKEFVRGMYYLFFIVTAVNFLTVIFPPLQVNGMYFLGGKNAIQMTMLPAIVFFYLYSYFNYNRLRRVPFIAILLAILSMYISASGTGIVIALGCTAFLIFPKKKAPNFYVYLVGYAVLFFSIVIYRLQEKLFGDFIVNVLHKNLTLTNRTIIWDFVLYVLKGNWIIGLGRGNTIIRDNNYFGVTETHNGILEVIMYTGILGLAIFIIILLLVAKNINQHRDNAISSILAFSVFAYMIIGLSESVFFKVQFWVLIILAYCIQEILNQKGDTERIGLEVEQNSKKHISQ